MITLSKLRTILAKVEYKPYTEFKVIVQKDVGFFIQYTDVEEKPVKGRKWYISKRSTEHEVIATCYEAILHYEKQKIQRRFHYNGRPIYTPYMKPEQLTKIADDLETRT